MRQATSDPQYGIPWNTRHHTDLDFADDLALLGENAKSLKSMTDNLASTAAKVGLRISTEKTKVMSVREQEPLVLKVNQQEAEEVENFTYLGSGISNKGATERDISCQLGKAASVFQRLSSIRISNHISMKSKLSLSYNSLVIPVAIYASETWKSNNNLAHKLDVFHHRCLRKLLKISWRDHVTNDDVWQRSGQQKLSEIVKECHLKMLGHILRIPEERLPKHHWSGHLLEVRERGRPVTTWRRTIQQDLRDMGISWEESKTIAADRIKWRADVAQCSQLELEELKKKHVSTNRKIPYS